MTEETSKPLYCIFIHIHTPLATYKGRLDIHDGIGTDKDKLLETIEIEYKCLKRSPTGLTIELAPDKFIVLGEGLVGNSSMRLVCGFYSDFTETLAWNKVCREL